MKKLNLTKNDWMPLGLFSLGLLLLAVGIFMKSLLAIAGVAGLLLAWFFSIDNVIANHKMSPVKLIVFGSIILFLPCFFAIYLGT